MSCILTSNNMADDIFLDLFVGGWRHSFKSGLDGHGGRSDDACAADIVRGFVDRLKQQNRSGNDPRSRVIAIAIIEALGESRAGAPAGARPLAAFATADLALCCYNWFMDDYRRLATVLCLASSMGPPPGVGTASALTLNWGGHPCHVLESQSWLQLSWAIQQSGCDATLVAALSSWVQRAAGWRGVAKTIADSALVGRSLLDCLKGETGSPDGVVPACRIFELVGKHLEEDRLQDTLQALRQGISAWFARARCALQPPAEAEACFAAAEACVRTAAAITLQKNATKILLRTVVPALLAGLAAILISEKPSAVACAAVSAASVTRHWGDASETCVACAAPLGSSAAVEEVSITTALCRAGKAEATPVAAVASAGAVEATASTAATSATDFVPVACPVTTAALVPGPLHPLGTAASKMASCMVTSLHQLFNAQDDNRSFQKQALRSGAEATFASVLVRGDDAAACAASKALGLLFVVHRSHFVTLMRDQPLQRAAAARLTQLLSKAECTPEDAEAHCALLEKLLLCDTQPEPSGSAAGRSGLPRVLDEASGLLLLESASAFTAADCFSAATSESLLALNTLPAAPNAWGVPVKRGNAVVFRCVRIAGAAAQAAAAMCRADAVDGAVTSGCMAYGSPAWLHARRILLAVLRLFKLDAATGPHDRGIRDAALAVTALPSLWYALVSAQCESARATAIADLGRETALHALQRLTAVHQVLHTRNCNCEWGDASSDDSGDGYDSDEDLQ